jgi:hypothetical protein
VDAFWDRNETIQHLATLDDMSRHLRTPVPFQVLADIDASRNPMHLTRERLERAATENQFMNGKIQALEVRINTLTFAVHHTYEGMTVIYIRLLVSSSRTGGTWMRPSCRVFPTLPLIYSLMMLKPFPLILPIRSMRRLRMHMLMYISMAPLMVCSARNTSISSKEVWVSLSVSCHSAGNTDVRGKLTWLQA